MPVDATAAAARQVLVSAWERPATLHGTCRVVALDGPAGSGKTTLAASVERAADEHRVEVVHMDDLYDGWRGVLSVNALVATLLRCLHADRSAYYRRYDWHAGSYAEVRRVDLPDLLVLEGVGCSTPACDPLVTLRVWVDAPRELRLERGLRRDGVELRDRWEQFLVDEQRVHERDRTRERAELRVDGRTGEVIPAEAAPGPSGRR